MLLSYIITSEILSEVEFIDYQNLRVLSALATAALIFKVMDWLRIFDGTAFYIQLIARAISDISTFISILLIAAIGFAIPIHLISLGWKSNQTTLNPGELIKVYLYETYLLSLGEFPIGDWEKSGGDWVWVNQAFFVGSTFIINITMMNMLIAIVNDTFCIMYAARKTKSMKVKYHFISDLER